MLQQSRQSAKLFLRIGTSPPPSPADKYAPSWFRRDFVERRVGGGSQFGRGDIHCGTLGIFMCTFCMLPWHCRMAEPRVWWIFLLKRGWNCTILYCPVMFLFQCTATSGAPSGTRWQRWELSAISNSWCGIVIRWCFAGCFLLWTGSFLAFSSPPEHPWHPIYQLMALCVIVCQLEVAGGEGEFGWACYWVCVRVFTTEKRTELGYARWNFCRDSCLNTYLSLVLKKIKKEK